MATLALAQVPDATRYGLVETAEDGRILSFREKGSARGPGCINGGVYVLTRVALDSVPAGVSCSLERDVFPGLLGSRFYGVPSAAFFVDIGIPDDYLRLQADPAALLTAP